MPENTLVCKQCNFENEPERVYCHNCGAKLDRSLLPPEATKREDPVVVQQRVRKMIKPRGVSPLVRIRGFVTCVLISAILAAMIVMAKAPAGAPTLSQEQVMDAPTITDDMEAQQQVAGSHALRYTDDQVNAFLQSSVKGKDPDSTVQFKRAFVHFEDGICRITTEESIFGLSLFATTVRSVSLQNGKLESQTLGGSFGRLPIPSKAMSFFENTFAPLWKVLEHDRKLVSQMQSITFRKGAVEMVTKATPVVK